MSLRSEQFSKDFSPIVVTEEGIITLFKERQPENALLPIVSMKEGIVIEVICWLPSKTPFLNRIR